MLQHILSSSSLPAFRCFNQICILSEPQVSSVTFLLSNRLSKLQSSDPVCFTSWNNLSLESLLCSECVMTWRRLVFTAWRSIAFGMRQGRNASCFSQRSEILDDAQFTQILSLEFEDQSDWISQRVRVRDMVCGV